MSKEQVENINTDQEQEKFLKSQASQVARVLIHESINVILFTIMYRRSDEEHKEQMKQFLQEAKNQVYDITVKQAMFYPTYKEEFKDSLEKHIKNSLDGMLEPLEELDKEE